MDNFTHMIQSQDMSEKLSEFKRIPQRFLFWSMECENIIEKQKEDNYQVALKTISFL